MTRRGPLTGAELVLVHDPGLQFAGTGPAEIRAKWPNAEELNEREVLSDDVLERSARQAPAVSALQGKACLGRRGVASLIDTVNIVQNTECRADLP